MRVETVKCDQCGAIKGESNHWLTMDVQKFNQSDTFPQYRIRINGGSASERVNWESRDLCGQACFHQHLDMLLFKHSVAAAMDDAEVRVFMEPAKQVAQDS